MALDYDATTITDDAVQGEAKVTVYEIFKGLATNIGLLILVIIVSIVIGVFGFKLDRILHGGR